MNKILKGLCMVALVALAFTSCKKDDNNAKSFYAYPGEVAFEEDGADKAYINGSVLMMEAGDEVMLYNIDNVNAANSVYGLYTTDATGTPVHFTYQEGPIANNGTKMDAFFAFYPGGIVDNSQLANDNYAVFSIPKEQVYREVNGVSTLPANGWAMAAKDDTHANIADANFKFQTIMGGLCLKLTSTSGKTVRSLEVTDNGSPITGDVHLKIHKVNPNTLTSLINSYNPTDDTFLANLQSYIHEAGYYVDGANKGQRISLNCGNGVALNGKTPKPFYVCVRPAAFYYGFSISVNFTDGTHALIETSKNKMVKPGVIKSTSVNVDNYLVD